MMNEEGASGAARAVMNESHPRSDQVQEMEELTAALKLLMEPKPVKEPSSEASKVGKEIALSLVDALRSIGVAATTAASAEKSGSQDTPMITTMMKHLNISA